MDEVNVALNYKILWGVLIVIAVLFGALMATLIKITIDNVSPKNNTIANTGGIKQATA